MRIFALSFAFAVACHGASPSATVDASLDGAAIPDAPAPVAVAFTYTPDWLGVQSVDVIGAFGSSTDWTSSLASLVQGSDGTWTGSAMLAPGTYPYLFHVVGDVAAGSDAATFSRYSLDGTVSEFAACPGGPTMAANPMNPCSLVTVPQGAAEPAFTVHGAVVLNATAASKYLVVLERDEASSHHFFVNRRATGSGGMYTFSVPAGMYRVMILHGDFYAVDDAHIVPQTANTIRRDLSDAFAVGSDVIVSPADVTPPNYATFEPRTTATLPTTFTFPSGPATKLDVYGSGAEVGDPWFASTPATAAGSASFDGTFTTMAAGSAHIDPAVTYSWGIEWAAGGSDIKWTAQSLVYPIAWP